MIGLLDPLWFVAKVAFQCLFYAWALWVFFLAVMCLQSARDRGTLALTKWGTRFGYTVLVVGYVLDALNNFVTGSLLFAEFPQELTVSSRIKRHIESSDGWRKQRAEFVRDHFLRPYDPTGRHG
jgi:hypothetical protein